VVLADLYDPFSMPSDLLKAHEELDRFVERLIAPKRKFKSDSDRLGALFQRYEAMTARPLATKS